MGEMISSACLKAGRVGPVRRSGTGSTSIRRALASAIDTENLGFCRHTQGQRMAADLGVQHRQESRRVSAQCDGRRLPIRVANLDIPEIQIPRNGWGERLEAAFLDRPQARNPRLCCDIQRVADPAFAFVAALRYQLPSQFSRWALLNIDANCDCPPAVSHGGNRQAVAMADRTSESHWPDRRASAADRQKRIAGVPHRAQRGSRATPARQELDPPPERCPFNRFRQRCMSISEGFDRFGIDGETAGDQLDGRRQFDALRCQQWAKGNTASIEAWRHAIIVVRNHSHLNFCHRR